MTVLSADALLEIRGLRTWFPIRTGVLQARQRATCAPSTASTSPSSPARRWRWWANRAAARPRWGAAILQLVEATGGNIWFRGVNLVGAVGR